MKRFSIYTIIALATLFIGISIATIFAIRYSQSFIKTERAITVENQTPSETKVVSKTETPIEESPEAKAVRIAEEFVAQNGYTDLPADRNKITYETVEFAPNLDELLKMRANTLERKAYGILYKATGTKIKEKGWTVVFREKNVSDDYYKSIAQATGKKITRENYQIGRAVTMDANFQNLLVEHKVFPLQNVDKKF
ncbi:MAG: hypothetical protein M3209_06790 [Acidobacteriota bacterium]|nr:hypothetical protein [Acidobacteriota bacterium]